MNALKAKALIEQHGFKIAHIRLIPEGANHDVFEVALQDGTALIAKFKKRPQPGDHKQARRDTLFNGLVSLERESRLYRIVRQKAGLPAPEIFLKYESWETSFLLVEKLTGVLWREYLQQGGFSGEQFLRSMAYLGADIARLQQVKFKTFGDVMAEETILPAGFDNFSDRFLGVMKIRIERALSRGVFTKLELEPISHYFTARLGEVAEAFQVRNSEPVMVLTDMHADNFLVDTTGRPSGYFDLESSQAAPPGLEFYGLKFFLFNYFNETFFKLAEESFFAGYESAGGVYDRLNGANLKLEKVLAAGRLLELSESYFGVKDGLRDNWSSRFKKLFWQATEADQVDYQAVGDIFREKTGQPQTPYID